MYKKIVDSVNDSRARRFLLISFNPQTKTFVSPKLQKRKNSKERQVALYIPCLFSEFFFSYKKCKSNPWKDLTT